MIKSIFEGIYDNERRFLYTVFMLAFALRIFFIIYEFPTYCPDGGEHNDIAWNMLTGNGFSIKFYWMPEGGSTAAIAPIYPCFLAFIYWLFPVGKYLAVQLAQSVPSSLICISGYFIAKRAFSRDVAVFSSLLMALSIFLIKTTLLIRRSSFIVLFLSLVVLVTLKLAETTRTKDWVGYGLLVGVTVLIFPELMGFIPFAITWIYYYNQAERWVKIKRIALMLITSVLVVSPWLVRNYLVFDRFVPIVSSFGANLWEGNNPNASGSDYIYPTGHAKLDKRLIQKMGSKRDEIERMDILKQEALEFIRQNPRRFIELRLKSFFYFWFTHYNWEKLNRLPSNKITLAATLAMNIFAIIGLALYYRNRNRSPGANLLIMLLFAISFIYTITHASSTYRYRLPLDPYLLMFAAVAINRVKSTLLPALTK